MSSFKARLLLNVLAENYQHQKLAFSKPQIAKKINEIKYLSAQKKIPRLSLRKEIVHLEAQLKSILELEKKLLKQKKYESAKIAALKKRNKKLKGQLAATKDKDLHHKVEKLTHHLGDHLAKAATKKDIQMSKKIADIKAEGPKIITKYKDVQEIPNADYRLHILHQRLEALKHELSIKKVAEKNPKKVKVIDNQIKALEEKLNQISHCSLPAGGQVFKTKQPRHKMLFGASKEEPKEEIKSPEDLKTALPLPPPPRIAKPVSKELKLTLPAHSQPQPT